MFMKEIFSWGEWLFSWKIWRRWKFVGDTDVVVINWMFSICIARERLIVSRWIRMLVIVCWRVVLVISWIARITVPMTMVSVNILSVGAAVIWIVATFHPLATTVRLTIVLCVIRIIKAVRFMAILVKTTRSIMVTDRVIEGLVGCRIRMGLCCSWRIISVWFVWSYLPIWFVGTHRFGNVLRNMTRISESTWRFDAWFGVVVLNFYIRSTWWDRRRRRWRDLKYPIAWNFRWKSQWRWRWTRMRQLLMRMTFGKMSRGERIMRITNSWIWRTVFGLGWITFFWALGLICLLRTEEKWLFLLVFGAATMTSFPSNRISVQTVLFVVTATAARAAPGTSFPFAIATSFTPSNHLHLSLGLHATVLEPNFHLPFGQIKCCRNFYSSRSTKVFIEEKLFLKFQKLWVCICGAQSSGHSFLFIWKKG